MPDMVPPASAVVAAACCLQILSDDYSKVAFLCADRSVAFHARFGSYFKTRTPRQVGREGGLEAVYGVREGGLAGHRGCRALGDILAIRDVLLYVTGCLCGCMWGVAHRGLLSRQYHCSNHKRTPVMGYDHTTCVVSCPPFPSPSPPPQHTHTHRVVTWPTPLRLLSCWWWAPALRCTGSTWRRGAS
jgi:hypothetical protein